MKDRIKEIVDKDVVVHIKTLEQLIELNKVVRELGIRPLYNDHYSNIKTSDFCVRISSYTCMWDNLTYYKTNGYKIIEFEDLCKNNTIVIYRKGNEVIALDKRTGKKAVAKCDPRDTFDFNIGAKLAFERLTIEPKPQLLNTKICILNEIEAHLTKGKIYEIKNGFFRDDKGDTYPMSVPLANIDDLKDYFRASGTAGKRGCKYSGLGVEFIEVVE